MENAIRDLKHEIDNAKASTPSELHDPTALSDKLEVAQRVIAEGERAIDDLNGQISKLDKEKADLQQEKVNLQQVQTALTSGLIGAVVTAIVAIAGVIMKTLGSRVDKDLKRLGVVEKVAELTSKGVSIPADIIQAYEMKESTKLPSSA